MRVRVIYELKNRGGWVPFHHQFLLSDYIEEIIKKELPQYSDFQKYNFSGLKGQTKIGKNGLHFYSNKVTLVIASSEKVFIDNLLKGIFTQKDVAIGKLILEPESVEIESEPDITEQTKFICISPLVITPFDSEIGASKQFLNPTEDAFSDLLYESTMYKLEDEASFSEEEIANYFKFQVDPDRKYLAKIRASEKKFSRIYPCYEGDTKHEVRGYTFPFILYVDKKVQKFIFETGFGEYTHKGFGMLDIANVDPIGRAKPYEFN